MTPSDEPSRELVPGSSNLPSKDFDDLPEIFHRAGAAARYAGEEFFYGRISNDYTRAAYRRAVKRFLQWCENFDVELKEITPKMVRSYLDGLKQAELSVATRKQHLAALRHFFDTLVTRHAVIINPAASVRGDRYQVVEGKTPEITVADARRLLNSFDTSHVVGLRDRAIVAILIYTAARAGAVAKLKRGNFYHAGDQWMLHFDEKGGKVRQIPVRHDLQEMIFQYLEAAGLRAARKDTPLFRSALKRQRILTTHPIAVHDICRMVKRRLKDAELSSQLSPHSFRVTTITNLLEQGVPLEDVQQLAGHADPRTTRLYDRRQKKITRNIVERISI